MKRVVFLSETLYFGVNVGNLIYPNSSIIPEYISGFKKHGILFSSDVSSACYDLNTAPAPSTVSPKLITSSGILTPCPNPFIQDFSLILAAETLTPIKLNLASVSQWENFCPTLEFRYPFVSTSTP